jgi:hypothetical protein
MRQMTLRHPLCAKSDIGPLFQYPKEAPGGMFPSLLDDADAAKDEAANEDGPIVGQNC